eukprot:400801_1
MKSIKQATKNMHARMSSTIGKRTIIKTKQTVMVNKNTNVPQSMFIPSLQFHPHLNIQTSDTYLLTLLQHIETDTISKHQAEEHIPAFLQIITTTLFRTLPPASSNVQHDDEYPSWTHLKLVYEILQRFVTTASLQTLQKHITKTFLINMINLFNSPNALEREYLKQIIHTIYRRCQLCRNNIRIAINNYFYSMIYSNKPYNGIADLLQILSSIINGFMLPLKSQNISLLTQVFIPMHKVSFLHQFHKQLVYCILQFIQKDISLATNVI